MKKYSLSSIKFDLEALDSSKINLMTSVPIIKSMRTVGIMVLKKQILAEIKNIAKIRIICYSIQK